MTAGKVIAYIVAAIAIFFGFILAAIPIFFGILFIWGAFSPEGNTGWILIGGISVVIGLGIIIAIILGVVWLVKRMRSMQDQDVIMKIDLSGDIDLDTLQCKSCGGTISSENITLVAGAPMVKCPYCGSEYQITEDPKW